MLFANVNLLGLPTQLGTIFFHRFFFDPIATSTFGICANPKSFYVFFCNIQTKLRKPTNHHFAYFCKTVQT